jgi:hypothetical protein
VGWIFPTAARFPIDGQTAVPAVFDLINNGHQLQLMAMD